jgi:hypothetical protein
LPTICTCSSTSDVNQLAKNMLIRTWDGVKWLIDYYDGDCQKGI